MSQDCHPRKSVLPKGEKLGSKHTVTFSKGTWHHIKNPGKKGSIARNCAKSVSAPKFVEKTQRRNFAPRKMRRQRSTGLGEKCPKAQKQRQGYVLLLYRSVGNHRYVVVVQDLATQWIQSYPCKTKTSQEREKSSRKFLEPSEKPKVFYIDNTLEFATCEDLFIMESSDFNTSIDLRRMPKDQYAE